MFGLIRLLWHRLSLLEATVSHLEDNSITPQGPLTARVPGSAQAVVLLGVQLITGSCAALINNTAQRVDDIEDVLRQIGAITHDDD